MTKRIFYPYGYTEAGNMNYDGCGVFDSHDYARQYLIQKVKERMVPDDTDEGQAFNGSLEAVLYELENLPEGAKLDVGLDDYGIGWYLTRYENPLSFEQFQKLRVKIDRVEISDNPHAEDLRYYDCTGTVYVYEVPYYTPVGIEYSMVYIETNRYGYKYGAMIDRTEQLSDNLRDVELALYRFLVWETGSDEQWMLSRLEDELTPHEFERQKRIVLNYTVDSIIEEIEASATLKKCKTFGELHDHCDANCLGGLCEDWHPLEEYAPLNDEGHPDIIDLLNQVQDTVNGYLQGRNRGRG